MYASDVVQLLATVFTPMFSYLDAVGDRQRLRDTLVQGNRYSSFVAFSLAAALLVMGKSIIRVWVGPQYETSYGILVVLAIPMALFAAQAASPRVLYGMARHRTLAVALLVEGVANVALSILLLRRYGLLGVALGTAVPMAITSVFFLPAHVCRAVGLRLRDYLRDAHLYPLLLAIAFGLVLSIMERWVHALTYVDVALELVSAGGVCVAGALTLRYFWARAAKPRSPQDGEVAKPAAPV
jgi:O-antigen/teichoic acid export membrane protein